MLGQRFEALHWRYKLGLLKLTLLVVGLPLVLLAEAYKPEVDADPSPSQAQAQALASDDGRCRVTAPRGWVTRKSEGAADELWLMDATHAMNLRVIPEAKSGSHDLTSYTNLVRDATRSRLAAKYDGVEADPTTDTTHAGAPARRTAIRFTHTGTPLTMELIVFETPAQFVQLAVTGPRDRERWKGSELEALLASVAITDPARAGVERLAPRARPPGSGSRAAATARRGEIERGLRRRGAALATTTRSFTRSSTCATRRCSSARRSSSSRVRVRLRSSTPACSSTSPASSASRIRRAP